MKTLKMSLANIQGKLSRNEMRSIMAGSGDDGGYKICSQRTCTGGQCMEWQGPNLTFGCNCFANNIKGAACVS